MRLGLSAESLCVDVGSNDGTLLTGFQEARHAHARDRADRHRAHRQRRERDRDDRGVLHRGPGPRHRPRVRPRRRHHDDQRLRPHGDAGRGDARPFAPAGQGRRVRVREPLPAGHPGDEPVRHHLPRAHPRLQREIALHAGRLLRDGGLRRAACRALRWQHPRVRRTQGLASCQLGCGRAAGARGVQPACTSRRAGGLSSSACTPVATVS